MCSSDSQCSSYARTMLVKANYRLRGMIHGSRESEHQKKTVKEARNTFDATPVGILNLQRLLARTGKKDYSKRLKDAKQHIELNSLQPDGKSSSSDSHFFTPEELRRIKISFSEAVTHALPDPKTVRASWSKQSEGGFFTPQVEALIDESGRWMASLTSNEHEAVSWYTSDGAQVINPYLIDGKTDQYGSKYSDQQIERGIKDLESALNKYVSHHSSVVWRGIGKDYITDEFIRDNYDPELKGKLVREKVRDDFKVGKTWEPGVPLSASYDPAVAYGFTFFAGAVLEIKGSSHAPTSVPSFWEAKEKEAITNPQARYLVTGIEEGNLLTLSPAVGEVTSRKVNVLIIQMEEI